MELSALMNFFFGEFLKDKGIIYQSTCQDTPQQNEIAERRNRHLIKGACAIMFSMYVPEYIWREAILTATYLINKMSSKILNVKTPIDFLNCPASHIYLELLLEVFGCTTHVHIPRHFRSKLDHRVVKCIFVGYSSSKKSYKMFDPHTNIFL